MGIETFTQFIQAQPKIAIILIALAMSFMITFVNNLIMDKERMREIKKRQKELQKQMAEHRKAGNNQKVMELNKELMSYVGETFKHTLKPTLITIVPIIILYSFIRGAFAETTLSSSWFWWYLAGAMGGSLIFRKVFKMP